MLSLSRGRKVLRKTDGAKYVAVVKENQIEVTKDTNFGWRLKFQPDILYTVYNIMV